MHQFTATQPKLAAEFLRADREGRLSRPKNKTANALAGAVRAFRQRGVPTRSRPSFFVFLLKFMAFFPPGLFAQRSRSQPGLKVRSPTDFSRLGNTQLRESMQSSYPSTLAAIGAKCWFPLGMLDSLATARIVPSG
jgi:hypothetical protein